MRDRYLHHITLQSGDLRRSPRSEVGPGIAERLWPVMDRALRGEHAPVPGQPGYTLTGGSAGRCCSLTLWGMASDTATPERQPVLTVGIASHSRCGAGLWRRLHEMSTTPLATDAARCPPEPWCADLLQPGALLHAESLEWTGDLSRCLAWTWIERPRDRQ